MDEQRVIVAMDQPGTSGPIYLQDIEGVDVNLQICFTFFKYHGGIRDIGVQYFTRKMKGSQSNDWTTCSSMKNDAYIQEKRSEKLS
ncbi:hypothetical protein CFP56_005097 [Quercus suber]|uniref:Uncharacterized protein n=1 Tax=Quercus suber TaxID=58331 RepID=A0AAW0LBP7_QUESU